MLLGMKNHHEITVTDVQPLVLRVALREPIYTAFGRMDARTCVLVRVETDVGITGIGESWVNYPSWAPTERIATLTQGLRPLLIGLRLTHPRDLWQHCVSHLHVLALQWGAVGPIYQALSGIDIALWDIFGQAQGAPVWQLLDGASYAEVPAYASGLAQRRQSDVGQLAARLVEDGFSAVKVKIGFGREVDEHNLRDVRAAIGHATFLADVNQGWTLHTAQETAPLLEDLGVFWLEEPLPVDDRAGWTALRASTALRLAGGENLYGTTQFDDWAVQFLDVVQPDICKCGGFTAAAAIFARSSAPGRLLAPHYFGGAVGLAATIHMFAALSSSQRFLVEYDVTANPLRDELLDEPLLVRPGILRVPDSSGLGIRLNDKAVAQWQC
ncbi:MAG: mandelate racemase/muconate lactonizing enzyme family protein [Chloroflexi bacterium]|nr:mandelate racemase/muconate lactonizing enzyme family protein [Chloroflexota bacterium]